MNFYNPFLYTAPVTSSASLFSRLNLGSILSGTTRVLNFANQAIPMFKQISPMVKNMKTMFKVMNEFKKTDSGPSNVDIPNISSNNQFTYANNNGPTFFV